VRLDPNRALINLLATNSAANYHSNNKFTPSQTLVKCYLCGKDTAHFYTTPSQPARRIEFLSSIVIRGAREYTRVEKLKSNRNIVKICPSHVSERQSVNIPSKQMAQKVYRKCDLCDNPAYPSYSSPDNVVAAMRFFENIIGV
ncbi:hypothetical protein PENTCL1PPCAC_5234, partial [Pristionchus entomophagus]